MWFISLRGDHSWMPTLCCLQINSKNPCAIVGATLLLCCSTAAVSHSVPLTCKWNMVTNLFFWYSYCREHRFRFVVNGVWYFILEVEDLWVFWVSNLPSAEKTELPLVSGLELLACSSSLLPFLANTSFLDSALVHPLKSYMYHFFSHLFVDKPGLSYAYITPSLTASVCDGPILCQSCVYLFPVLGPTMSVCVLQQLLCFIFICFAPELF